MSLWCPVPQGENYCLSGEPCCPNTNLSSGVLLFFSHRFSLLPLCNRATYDLKSHQKPCNLLLVDWHAPINTDHWLGLVCIWVCASVWVFPSWWSRGVSKQKHGRSTPAESHRDHLTRSILHPAHSPLRNSLTGTNHISLFSLMLRMALTALPPSTAKLDLSVTCMTSSGFPASVPASLRVSVSVRLPPPNCLCAFRCRNKSQKSKFDEELHNEMTTTIDELSSKWVHFYNKSDHIVCM